MMEFGKEIQNTDSGLFCYPPCAYRVMYITQLAGALNGIIVLIFMIKLCQIHVPGTPIAVLKNKLIMTGTGVTIQ